MLHAEQVCDTLKVRWEAEQAAEGERVFSRALRSSGGSTANAGQWSCSQLQ